MTKISSKFSSRIRRFSRVRRRVANRTRAYGSLTSAAVAGIIGLLLLAGWIENPFVNGTLYAALAVTWLVLLVGYLVRVERRKSVMSEAFRMEALSGDLDSRLVSALDFMTWPSRTALTQLVINRAEKDLANGFEKLIDRRALTARRTRCFMIVVLFVLLGLTPWFGFMRAYDNGLDTMFALREYFFPTLYSIDPTPGRHIYSIGEQVEVKIEFAHRSFDTVTLVDEQAGMEPRRYALEVVNSSAGFVLIGDNESEHRLKFEFGRRKTDEIVAVFTSRPILENMQTELIYPGYTRLVPRDLEGVQYRLSGLTGTRITIGFTFSKDLEEASLTWDNGEELPLEVMGRFASISLINTVARRCSVQVEDIHGFGLEYPHSMEFNVTEDAAPRVYAPKYLKKDMPSLGDELNSFGVGVRAQDDYGVAKCVFKWSKSTLDNRNTVLDKGEVERLVTPPLPKAIVEFNNVFESLSVRPGDLISFKVEAYDNRVPDSQRASSPTYSFFIHQEGLESRGFGADLAFGKLQQRWGARIARAKAEREVLPTQDLKSTETFKNEFDADIKSLSRRPVVRGEHAASVDRYFMILSSARFKEGEQ